MHSPSHHCLELAQNKENPIAACLRQKVMLTSVWLCYFTGLTLETSVEINFADNVIASEGLNILVDSGTGS